MHLGVDTRGGSRGSGPPLSRLSLHLNTSFSLFRLDLCAFTAIQWAGGATACCALKILLGYLSMRRHVREAFISEPSSFNFLDPPLALVVGWHYSPWTHLRLQWLAQIAVSPVRVSIQVNQVNMEAPCSFIRESDLLLSTVQSIFVKMYHDQECFRTNKSITLHLLSQAKTRQTENLCV